MPKLTAPTLSMVQLVLTVAVTLIFCVAVPAIAFVAEAIAMIDAAAKDILKEFIIGSS